MKHEYACTCRRSFHFTERTCSVAVVAVGTALTGKIHAVAGETNLARLSSETARTHAAVSRALASVHARDAVGAHHAVALASDPARLAVAREVGHRVGIGASGHLVAGSVSATLLLVAVVDVFAVVAEHALGALAAGLI